MTSVIGLPSSDNTDYQGRFFRSASLLHAPGEQRIAVAAILDQDDQTRMLEDMYAKYPECAVYVAFSEHSTAGTAESVR